MTWNIFVWYLREYFINKSRIMLQISCTKLQFGLVSHVLGMTIFGQIYWKCLYRIIQITSRIYGILTSLFWYFAVRRINWQVFVIFTCVHLNYEWKAKSRMERKNWQNSELTKPRLIKADWLVTFPWLINKNTLFRCNICVNTKTSNVFVSSKDDLVNHQSSTDNDNW